MPNLSFRVLAQVGCWEGMFRVGGTEIGKILLLYSINAFEVTTKGSMYGRTQTSTMQDTDHLHQCLGAWRVPDPGSLAWTHWKAYSKKDVIVKML